AAFPQDPGRGQRAAPESPLRRGRSHQERTGQTSRRGRPRSGPDIRRVKARTGGRPHRRDPGHHARARPGASLSEGGRKPRALTGYAVRRLLVTVPLALGAATIVFLFLHLVPGDPVQAMLGPAARESELQALRLRLGLDRPLAVQYADYLGGLARGDLGTSLHYGDPVAGLLAERLPLTAALATA